MGVLSLLLVGTLVNEPSGAEEERQQLLSKGLRVDYVGFVLVAVGLGSLEFVLDQGQRKDWFGSNMIVSFALVSAFCLIAGRPPSRLRAALLGIYGQTSPPLLTCQQKSTGTAA